MSLSETDIRRLAHLARIDVDERAVEAVRRQLDGILALIDELQAVDTTGVVPMAHAQDVAAALRDDRVTEHDQRETFQSVAPAVERGLYLVPKVIE